MKAHKRIRAYREANKIRAAELAKRLGVAESTLRSYENGTRPIQPEMAVTMERELGIPRADFCPEIFGRIA